MLPSIISHFPNKVLHAFYHAILAYNKQKVTIPIIFRNPGETPGLESTVTATLAVITINLVSSFFHPTLKEKSNVTRGRKKLSALESGNQTSFSEIGLTTAHVQSVKVLSDYNIKTTTHWEILLSLQPETALSG